MNDQWLESMQAEEARIQTAYAKRAHPRARYSWFSPGYLFMMQDLERQMLKLLQRYEFAELQQRKILEVGCGTGQWLREFIKWGARPEHITGIDLLPSRVAEATRLCPPQVNVSCGSATQLDYPPASFDLILQSTVFTSILNIEMKQRIAAEMLRVLKNDGLILWYDYHINNPTNPDVKGVPKREIYKLFPQCRIRLQRVTLAPPLVRLLAPYSWSLCFWLGQVSVLCTHYLGGIQKGGTRARTVSAVPCS